MKRQPRSQRPSRPIVRYRPELFPLEERLPPGDTLGILSGLGLLGSSLAAAEVGPARAAATHRHEPFPAVADLDITELGVGDLAATLQGLALVPAAAVGQPAPWAGASAADQPALIPGDASTGRWTRGVNVPRLPAAALPMGEAAEYLASWTGGRLPALSGAAAGQAAAPGPNGAAGVFRASLSAAAATPVADAATPVRFDPASGQLAVWAQAGPSVREGLTPAGFVSLSIGGALHSSDPAAAAYDPALAGASGRRLTGLRLDGGTAAPLELATQTLAGPFTVHADGPVLVQGDVAAGGALTITAAAVTVRGGLHGPSVSLASPGLVTVDQGAAVTAAQVEIAAGVLVNVGGIQADGRAGGQVDVHAGNVLNAGRITADGGAGAGGTVAVAFTGSYIDTAAAVTAAAGRRGGRVQLDGGGTGRLFSSGRQQATGTVAGGTVSLHGAAVVLVGAALDASGAGGVVDVGGRGPDVWASAATRVRAEGGRVVMAPAARAAGGSATPGVAGLLDPHPEVGGAFGGALTPLANGNLLVSNPEDSFAAAAGGAVYLMSGRGGALLSMLVGAEAHDRLGNVPPGAAPAAAGPGNDAGGGPEDGPPPPPAGGPSGITSLTNGNYVVASPSWNGNQGAVTWGDGTVGVSGVVDASNSLVGSHTGDDVGSSGVTALSNGNYVVASSIWNGGSSNGFGAVTWGDGAVGVSGVVDASNSLVGSHNRDYVGFDTYGLNGVTALSNGNYVVASPSWNGNQGAVTWGDGTVGLSGVVDASNSLVGSHNGDHVGFSGIAALSNGNYVIASPSWNGGPSNGFGAVTWGDGTVGVRGVVDASNSLVGSHTGDLAGNGVTALSNGNYVFVSPSWNGYQGAVTWGDGTVGVSGVVDASNSLVGSHTGDDVGSLGVTALSNGNYVVNSLTWNGGIFYGFGAVTWGDGTVGVRGVVDASNSLVGSHTGDHVGDVTALSNGNYVVASPSWNGGSSNGFGAVTWGDGTVGVSGVVDASNSLVGSNPGDSVGYPGVTALSNGNYVVASRSWNGNQGAVTWGDGTVGVSGVVDASNSLVGS